MSNNSNTGNEAWQRLRAQSEKLYARCPLLMYRQIQRVLQESKYDLFNFENHSSLVDLIQGSPKNNRPHHILYHFTENRFIGTERFETKIITAHLHELIPRVSIIGIYRSRDGFQEMLLSHGVNYALEYSPREGSEFEQSLCKILL